MFSFSGGRFFRKWPRKMPYPVRFRIGEPIPPKEARTDRVRQAMQRLAREAFAERPDMQQPLPELLEAALADKAGAAFLSIPAEDVNWTRGEVLALAKKPTGQYLDGELPLKDALPALLARALSGNEIRTGGITWEPTEVQANCLRLMENHLWSLEAFRVELEGSLDSPWDQTWLLWAPIFGRVSAEMESDGLLTLRQRGHSADPPDKPFGGLAIPGLGVVALNLPDPLRETDPDYQKGAAAGSFGRLLPGLELRQKDGSDESLEQGECGQLQVAGVTGEWYTASPRLRLDNQGFIFSENVVSE
jgi:hypothetical protein